MRVVRKSKSNSISYLDSLENLIKSLYKSCGVDYTPKIKEYDDLLNDLATAIEYAHTHKEDSGNSEDSLFELWKKMTNNPDATKEDFLDNITANSTSTEWGTF